MEPRPPRELCSRRRASGDELAGMGPRNLDRDEPTSLGTWLARITRAPSDRFGRFFVFGEVDEGAESRLRWPAFRAT